ncbi:hypothetical protein KCU64_g12233, partial [Aureobasidium melanogenum]
MSYLEHEADMMISDEEESGEETLPSKTKQAVKLNFSSSGAKTAKPPQFPAIHIDASKTRKLLSERRKERANHPLIERLTSGQRVEYIHKLEKLIQKLKSKTVDELTDLYYGIKDASFRDLIMKAFHQKRMDELKDWEEQIGE